MGAIGSSGQNDAVAYRGTPFLTAEIGGGMEGTYYRRPLISPDDIASLGPVMLGSGANLLGYYMFQGGRNPDGKLTTLQESQRTGYPTDVPVKSYDFQAPLSEFGEERESFRRMKLLNYFLNDFGAMLAPMKVDAPAVLPATPSDLTVPRIAVRSSGDHGFVFFNNYVRGASMPVRKGFQVRLMLASGKLLVPSRPIDLPSGAYGIWPINLDIGGVRLIYSTAQLFKLAQTGGQRYYFFFTVPGITPEFALDGDEELLTDRGASRVSGRNGVIYVRMAQPSAIQHVALAAPQGTVHIVLMSREVAEHLWTVDGSSSLIETATQVFSDQNRLYLRSIADPDFTFGLFGAQTPRGLHGAKHGLFTEYSIQVPPVKMELSATQIPSQPEIERPSQPTNIASASTEVPFAPEDKDFDDDAVWKLDTSSPSSSDVSNAYLRITYTGDVARLYAGDELLDDNFWNGRPWQIGLKQWQELLKSPGLQLHILPSPGDRTLGDVGEGDERARGKARLVRTQLLPEYQTSVDLGR
jgi:beta-galactosidase